MPKTAISSDSVVSFGQYSGVPTNPALTSIEYRSLSIQADDEMLTDPSMNGKRTAGQTIKGNRSVAGGLSVSYKPRIYDIIFANFFRSGWATNKIKHGSVESPLYFQRTVATDTPFTEQFIDCHVNTFNLKIADGVNSSLEFGMVGRDYDVKATVPTATITAAVAKSPMIHVNCVFKIDGTVIGYMTSFDLNASNGLTANNVLGATTARSITAANFTASGTFSALVESPAFATRWLTNYRGPVVVEASTGNEKDVWTMPNVVFGAVTYNENNGGALIQNIPFTADPDANSQVLGLERVTIV